MDDLVLQNIYVYPIKSLGGIELQQAEVEQTGLQYDRRWMLTDEKGNFLTQRKFAQMALLQTSIVKEGLVVSHKQQKLPPLTIPLNTTAGKEITVNIWDDTCTALEVSMEANRWFSDALKMPVKMVYMSDTTRRRVDNNYAMNNEIVSFADAYPLMIIGQSSLDELNSRLETPVLMNRFRPNLVFTGGVPFYEDSFDLFKIGNVSFKAVKPCYRCILTTINQEDGT
ncbi:MAG: MOSC N-terminal beta barrel domain-containing protein, partial [Bacteroidota bacterium]|nr:MOSC N-terminal beta barrel domain-containing protein [Bacteroidota bacterium]